MILISKKKKFKHKNKGREIEFLVKTKNQQNRDVGVQNEYYHIDSRK